MGEAKEKAKKKPKNVIRYQEIPDDIDVTELKIVLSGESEKRETLSYSDWYRCFVRHQLPNKTDEDWKVIDELDEALLDVEAGDKREFREDTWLAFVNARPQAQGLMYMTLTNFYRSSSTAKTVKPKDWDEPEEPEVPEDEEQESRKSTEPHTDSEKEDES